MEKVVIVDERNQVIGQADRSVMRRYNLPHRATYVLLTDSRLVMSKEADCSGRVYVQRRTETKDYCPGMLDPMTGGVVQHGESYLGKCLSRNPRRNGHHESSSSFRRDIFL
mmetsp:Transcript_27288/g.51179  ORF Transcript_27288/g.51179 Transcript_27288/m.51179 type:complete len:111 (-) Transcript_27288:189-521(-)